MLLGCGIWRICQGRGKFSFMGTPTPRESEDGGASPPLCCHYLLVAGRSSHSQARTRDRHVLSTQQRGPSLWDGKALQKDHVSSCSLLVEPQPQSPRGEAALATCQHSSYLDPAGLWLSSKCVGLLPNPFPAFPQSSAEQTGHHAAAASTPLLSALCLSPCSYMLFSAPLEKPFYSLVVQRCRSACTYIICRYSSTFFFLKALQRV